jgi:hypothetical protein
LKCFYRRFLRWSKNGVWESVATALAEAMAESGHYSIARDPDARTYTDQALTPVRDDEDLTLDLLTKTTGARAAIAHIKKVAEMTGGSRTA